MPTYTCNVCHFSSKIKCNYLSHLKTKKHLKNIKELDKRPNILETEKVKTIPKSKNTKTPININNFDTSIFLRNLHNLESPSQFFNQDSFRVLECESCGKTFSRPDNLKRHQEFRCLEKKNS